jgi:hypothetical protein
MPHGDGTGPMGLGPMTGRRAGFCAGYGVPGYANWVAGRGLGRRFGWGGVGRGWYTAGGPRWPGYGPDWPAVHSLSREQEVDLLKAQAQSLQEALKRVNDRLDALEKES